MEAPMKKFIQQQLAKLNDKPFSPRADVFWHNLRKTGTEIWLDTGDIEEASSIWSSEMSGLTTNNTLLNKEIQKGIYDNMVVEASKLLNDKDTEEKIKDIAFALNAIHGARLVKIFGARVSVELHTDLADDIEGIIQYGKRFHDIDPLHFIVKVPYTASGLIGARELSKAGIPVNITLGFSARQNLLAAVISKPQYVNVFLGRINAYVTNNKLGSGKLLGEKVTLASQKTIIKHAGDTVKQIAASIRHFNQLISLAGTHVFTIPTKVAKEGRKKLKAEFVDSTAISYTITLDGDNTPENTGLDKLWEIPGELTELVGQMRENTPVEGEQLEEIFRANGFTDMFPYLTKKEKNRIAKDGKIPVHEHWTNRFSTNEIAVDTLLNKAGLASFTADQLELDERIRRIIS